MDTTGMTPAMIDYAIFLQGVAAYKAGHARKAPDHLSRTNHGPYSKDDHDAGLWLAGYDSERAEMRLLARIANSIEA